MRSLALLALVAGACGSDLLDGPFAPLPLDVRLDVGLDAPVHVARDVHGLAHIHATTTADAMFVQGYVMAHDRFPQMDLMRRFAQGRLAELYGERDPGVIETDLRMRLHRLLAYAEQSHADLEASDDPRDVALLAALDRFAAGVNAYLLDLQAGRWTLDPALADALDPALTPAWTPHDSLSLVRFHTLAMSWTAPLEVELTDLYQRLDGTFAATPRAGVIADLLAFAPIGAAAPLPGFPGAGPDAPASPRTPPRPAVPPALLDQARATLAGDPRDGVDGALGPHAFLYPHLGANVWGIQDVAGGFLAADHQLPLGNPSSLYPIHITVAPADAADTAPRRAVVGLALVGVPGTIIGTNGHIAWATAPSGHDVNDLYLESCDATTCAGPDGPRSITAIAEQIDVGHRGDLRASRTATYEHVPGHGPIIPAIANGALVPRAPGPALSVRYTGHANSYEARALVALPDATSLDAALAIVADATHGGAWTFVDRQGTVAWTTDAIVPRRAPAAYAWHVRDAPDGAAPFFVLDGRGGHEWLATPVAAPHLPRLAPGVDRLVIVADADPVGATYDGDPLDQRDVAGDPLYAGIAYAAGLREDRALDLFATSSAPAADDIERFGHDTVSALGARVAPRLVDALAAAETGTGPADVAPYLATLTADERAALQAARGALAAWTFTTPAALDPTDDPTGDARTATLFHAWMYGFTREVLADELGLAGYPLARFTEDRLARIVDAILVRGTATLHADTAQALLCDRVATAGAESCTRVALEALVGALAHLATRDETRRAWGGAHRLAYGPLFADASGAFQLPALGEPGFPRGGDAWSIARAPHGGDDLDFTVTSASAHRFLAALRGDGLGDEPAIDVRLELSSGIVLDTRDAHYRDLVDRSFVPGTPFDVPITVDAINQHGESRWELR